MMACYQQLVRLEIIAVSASLEAEIENCGRIITTEFPELIAGAVELLTWTSKRHTLLPLTRGEAHFQIRKLQHVGIADFFKTINVVQLKDASAFSAILVSGNFTAADC